MKEKLNWWQLANIQIGCAICLPTLLVGQTLSQGYGFFSAIASIFIGNFLLLLLGLVMVKMSFQKEKTTIENAEQYFGKTGVKFLALILTFSLLGWFAIQLNMMSLSVIELFGLDDLNSLSHIGLNAIFGVMITVAVFYGIKSLSTLANWSVPLLLATLCYTLLTTDQESSLTIESQFSLRGVPSIIAFSLVAIIDSPTYFRHSKNLKDGFISVALVYGVVLPFLEIIGVLLALQAQGETFLKVLLGHHSNVWNIWVACFLILASWTTNNINIYSGSIYLGYLFKNFRYVVATLIFGGLGTLSACMNVLDHFESILRVVAVFIGSMGAVVMVRYASSDGLIPENPNTNLFAWILGIIVGILSMIGITITSVPILDAALGATTASYLIPVSTKKIQKSRRLIRWNRRNV